MVTPGKNSIAEGGEKVNGILKMKRAQIGPLTELLLIFEFIIKEKLVEIYQGFDHKRTTRFFINFYHF